MLLAAPTAFFSAGGSVEVGSLAALSFTQTQDSAEDVAAGFTYSYDLDNDGVCEFTSASPVYQLPAQRTSAPSYHRFLGRITDQNGESTTYAAQLLVTVPPDYFPTLAGLTWNYTGNEDGDPWSGSVRSLYEAYHGENSFVLETRVWAEDSIQKDFYRISGQSIGQIYGIYAEPDYSGDMSISPAVMSEVFAHPEGWSKSWQGYTYAGIYVSDTVEVPESFTATFDSTQTGKIASLTLANGVGFTQALLVEYTEIGTASFVYPGYIKDEQIVATTRSWYVRGIGLVREQYTEQTNWQKSTGETGTDNSEDFKEISYLPDWALYATVDPGGILRINGTAIGDDIRFATEGDVLIAYRNEIPQSYVLAVVHGVMINGLAGDDIIDLAGLSVRATISGGDGNDAIVGGLGAELIYGGDGNDQISGGAGMDTLYGNSGDDVIAGGLHRDSIMAGLGDDTVTAGDGPDIIYGGDGSDELRGGKGADYIEGKGKSDRIYGGTGDDTIHGNAGDDLIYGDDGDDSIYVNDGTNSLFRDTVYAGTGTDFIESDPMDLLI